MSRCTENLADNFERIGAILDEENEPVGSDSDLSEESDVEDSEYVESAAETSSEESDIGLDEPLTPPVEPPLQVA